MSTLLNLSCSTIEPTLSGVVSTLLNLSCSTQEPTLSSEYSIKLTLQYSRSCWTEYTIIPPGKCGSRLTSSFVGNCSVNVLYSSLGDRCRIKAVSCGSKVEQVVSSSRNEFISPWNNHLSLIVRREKKQNYLNLCWYYFYVIKAQNCCALQIIYPLLCVLDLLRVVITDNHLKKRRMASS